jgi:endonuclease V-like protein UPF0215 family
VKTQVRVLGIDDASFSFKDVKVPIVGVVVRLPGYVEGVMVSEVAMDGNDADQAIIEMLSRSRYRDQIKLVMLDGAALGGFNLVDIDALVKATGIPFCTLTRDRPNREAMRSALQKHFPDWQERLDLLLRHDPMEIPTKNGSVFVSVAGISSSDVQVLLAESLVCGAIPEPLRLAHLFATAMVKGESKGNS